MATIVQGDTLLLSKLGIATGQTTYSMGLAAGSTASPILMSQFGIDSVDTVPGGYTYVVENTSEVYTLGVVEAGSRFSRISAQAVNYTWSVNFAGANTTNYFTIGGSQNTSATLTAGKLNPQDPSETDLGQTDLVTIREHLLEATFDDDFNDHIGGGAGFGIARPKTIYVVDTYDGNTALCLRADSPIIMDDGTTMEVGDLEEGDILQGYAFAGLGDDSDSNYMDWSTETLRGFKRSVRVYNVTFSFAEKLYNINNGEVIGTYEHPMLVLDKELGKYRFKQLATLVLGDCLIKDIDGVLTEIVITSIEIDAGMEEIVSLDVETQDTFLTNGYISHNKGGDSHTDLTPPAAPNTPVWNIGLKTITWDAVSGASAYDVQIDDTSSAFGSLIVNETEWSSTLYTVIGYSGYAVARVRAIDHGLKGDWSPSAAATL
jgi:hypothetical protein